MRRPAASPASAGLVLVTSVDKTALLPSDDPFSPRSQDVELTPSVRWSLSHGRRSSTTPALAPVVGASFCSLAATSRSEPTIGLLTYFLPDLRAQPTRGSLRPATQVAFGILRTDNSNDARSSPDRPIPPPTQRCDCRLALEPPLARRTID
jgi:hypothetical protein